MLYRKYRPKSFRDVVGQEAIVKALTNSLAHGETAQVYLFSGPRGTGKTTVARIFAKALNCLNPKNGEPCGACENCQAIDRGKFLDLIEIDAASYRGIEETKELREAALLQPLAGRSKVFIIDECHMLTKEANNVLLKILEEPPARTYFILATTEPEKLLPTVLSRAQRYHFRYFTPQEIVGKLMRIAQEEGIDLAEDAARLIAQEARGSLRDAESLLTQTAAFTKTVDRAALLEALGLVGVETVANFLELLSEGVKNKQEALSLIHRTYEQGYDLELFTREVIKFLRKALLIRVHPEIAKLVGYDFSPAEFERIQHIAETNSPEHLKRLMDLLLNALYAFRRDLPILTLPLEIAVIEV